MITEIRNFEGLKSKPFPKLMRQSDGYLVFFEKPGAGMVLANPVEMLGSVKVGTFQTHFGMSAFTDLPTNEEVVLRNS